MAENPSDIAVRRSIGVDAEPDTVWNAVVNDSERAEWFGGPTELTPIEGSDATFTEADGTLRRATVDSAVPARHLAWTWRDDEGNATGQVTIDLTPAPSGTRVDVTETPRPTQFSAQNSVLAPRKVTQTPLRVARTAFVAEIDLVELEHMLLLRTFSPDRRGAMLPVCFA